VNLRGKKWFCLPPESGSARALGSYPEQRKILLILNSEITAIIVSWLLILAQLQAGSCTVKV